MGFSIYTTAFNLAKNGFQGWQKSLRSSCEFADEVIIALAPCEDNTEELIRNELSSYKNWQIHHAEFSRLDPLFDGRLKNFALQKCTQEFKIQIDADEYIPLWQKPIWESAAFQLKFSSNQVMAVPSVDIYKTWDGYKSVNYKTYLHHGTAYRGPAGNALKPGYFINTQFSDGTELINERFEALLAIVSGSRDIKELESECVPFVVHFGYLSQEERIKRNEEFWGEMWLKESNGTLPAHKLHNDISTFDHYEYKKHNLKL